MNNLCYSDSTPIRDNNNNSLAEAPLVDYSSPSENIRSTAESYNARHNDKSSASPDSIMLLCNDVNSRVAMSRFFESENIHSFAIDVDSVFPESVPTDVAVFLVDSAGSPSGEQLIARLAERYPDVPVISLEEPSLEPERRRRIARMTYACIIKPCEKSFLLQTVRQAMKLSRYARENRYLRQTIGVPVLPVPMVGVSAVIATLRKQIEAFARLDNTILLTGEPGTGKSTIAQQIHQSGPRSRYPFLVVSCNAIPSDILEADLFGIARNANSDRGPERPGRMELAHRGTIFLDHVESLSASLQRRLFHFLQDRTVYRLGSNEPRRIDTRIIASTSSDLAIACVQGRFRDELYFRLNALTLNAPALRDRIEDIPSLSREIMSKIAKANNRNLSILSTSAMNKLRQYSWPYNIHELETVLQKAMATAPDTVITENDISFDTMIQDARTDGAMGLAGLTMAEIERRAIIETINACGGNRAQSARKLGVSEKTIYNKIKQFKLRGIV